MLTFFSILFVISLVVTLVGGLVARSEDMVDAIQRYFRAIEWEEGERNIEARRSQAKEEIFGFVKIFIWPVGLFCWLKSIFTSEDKGTNSPFKNFLKIFK